jgi:SecD/SecF fusion protein
MLFAAAETKTFMETWLPYLVLTTGVIAAALFLIYFMADQDKRKRVAGTLLAVILAGFSVFCIFEGEGVRRGIDLKGGASFLVRVQPAEGKAVSPDSLAQAQSIIDKRLNPKGTLDVSVTPQGTDRLYVEVPGLDDKQIREAKETIEKVARLQFRLLHQDSYFQSGPNMGSIIPASADDTTPRPGYAKLRYLGNRESKKDGETEGEKPEQPDEYVWALNKAELSGKSVDNAVPDIQPGATSYMIHVDLEASDGDKMMEITSANVGRPMAICLENTPGEFDVVSAPVIQGRFGANFQITGKFSEEEARTLASQLMNPLENPLVVEQSSIISPSLGKETVEQGIRSTLMGLALTLLFMMFYYRLSGIIAVIGLVINLLLLLGTMRVFDQTLTMPGIAGIILTLGMSIDANVLIYERMREEFAQGRNLNSAIPASYDKAFSAIFDGNLTTLITSLIMITVATGAIQGFGLALSIGLICSMFSALVITRVCFMWLQGMGLQKLSFLSLIKNRLYDFMGQRKLWLTVSAVICTACIAIVAIKGERSLGYELRGGDQVMLKNIAGVTIADVEGALKDWRFETKDGQKFSHDNLSITTVTPIGGEGYVNIRSTPGTADNIKKTLSEKLGAGDAARAEAFINASSETMGSSVGSEMLTRSAWALVAGLVAIFIYLTFRFEMPFAIGGIVAILHDVIVAVGVCALAGKEIGLILIGAFLTIAGFSINDTIVIFDRVRENLRTMKGDFKDILNASISATLSRTVITSGVTALGVLAMYFFGGKALADFSFAMLIGMVSGVYSTIFIASPVVLWWANKRKADLRQQILDADALRLEALSGMEREAPAKAGAKDEKKEESGLTPA